MNTTLATFLSGLEGHLEAIEQSLDANLPLREGCPQRLYDAVRYSVLAPGKRIRPLLALLACETVGGDWRDALPAACAVEFIHVYSLIHDDLPCMDNDDLRRGLPTCHRQFDEATAVLAGDSLQMLAIETLCRHLPSKITGQACSILTEAAGWARLVGGQIDDLAAEGRFGQDYFGNQDKLTVLKNIHRRKTGALIEASLQLGSLVGGGEDLHSDRLSSYGRAIGLAFQIVDDCLDVESTAEQLGKNTRKDSTLGKLTYPELLGLQESKKLAEELLVEALDSISVFGDRSKKLAELAHFVVQRKS